MAQMKVTKIKKKYVNEYKLYIFYHLTRNKDHPIPTTTPKLTVSKAQVLNLMGGIGTHRNFF